MRLLPVVAVLALICAAQAWPFLRKDVKYQEQGIGVYYQSTWDQAYMHYQVDGGEWTVPPGVPMDVRNGEFFLAADEALESMSCVFNDGHNTWDNNGGMNYEISEVGTYEVADNRVSPLPVECTADGACGAGQCLASSDCLCADDYTTCSDDSPCGVNLDNDDLNCGACGLECLLGANDRTANCDNGTCNRVCLDGFQLCPDNTCNIDCPIGPGPGYVQMYYDVSNGMFSTAPTVYIHYKTDITDWDELPGHEMTPTSVGPNNTPVTDMYVLLIPANTLDYVFTDGMSWDNDNNANYSVSSPGVYVTHSSSHTVDTIATYPKGCPGDCNGNGNCLDGVCKCNDGSYLPDCSGTCDYEDGSYCGDNGTCDTALGCVCAEGFDSCSTVPGMCNTDVSSDVYNCGGCGEVCLPNASTLSATCTMGECIRTCADGYQECPDGTCMTQCPAPVLPGCELYSINSCAGDCIVTDPSFEANRWQTPKPTSPNYSPDFHGYSLYSAWVSIWYSQDRTSATVRLNVVAKTPEIEAAVLVTWDGVEGTSRQKSISQASHSTIQRPLTVSVRLNGYSDEYILPIDDVYFYWMTHNPYTLQGDGQRGALVEFFGWPHSEIAKEAEFLGKAGYMGARFFPANEQVMSWQPMEDQMNPWDFYYQPVSYRLNGRGGSRAELVNSIATLQSHGVRKDKDGVRQRPVVWAPNPEKDWGPKRAAPVPQPKQKRGAE
ncbi:glycoside hydrolase, family 13 [Kipferlia bialata]|uniref:Glycoside hydrolase, family 13 n=1 Tax=Kipferlia bialata TaxID=797122 RepID=A0A9K3CS28_9EUKA|nr:glycoside hydrolase, family 13 [Kipferlia bialata]|eukprot:g2039.t1